MLLEKKWYYVFSTVLRRVVFKISASRDNFLIPPQFCGGQEVVTNKNYKNISFILYKLCIVIS